MVACVCVYVSGRSQKLSAKATTYVRLEGKKFGQDTLEIYESVDVR